MNPDGRITERTEDDQGEGWVEMTEPLETELELLERKMEKFRRRQEIKNR